jgi:hypothetical protein
VSKQRPPKRDKTVSTRVPQDYFDEASARAEKEGRSLSAILRAFLMMFGQGEWPSPPVLPDENVRAQKQTKPKKKK